MKIELSQNELLEIINKGIDNLSTHSHLLGPVSRKKVTWVKSSVGFFELVFEEEDPIEDEEE